MTKRRVIMKIKTITIEKTIDNLIATLTIEQPLTVTAESSKVDMYKNPLDFSLREAKKVIHSLDYLELFADGVVITVEDFDGDKVEFYSKG